MHLIHTPLSLSFTHTAAALRRQWLAVRAFKALGGFVSIEHGLY